jgi:hypothetical protein
VRALDYLAEQGLLARRSLADAIALILEDRRRDGLRGLPQPAAR